MIPKQRPEIIDTFGDDLETEEFSVQVDDQAFSLMFDGLYSDKIQSIVREICSNAWDGHLDANKDDQPFVLSIPTYLDPTFRVRDFGVSMTHEQVMKLYTTVFRSTKRESNRYTGAKGLGSKSPFAYTDSFTSIAYKDGSKRTYLVGLNDRRIPTITFIGEEDTDEPDGFEVTFPALEHDAGKFEVAARRVLAAYSSYCPLPELNFSYSEPSVIMEASNWKLFRDESQALEHRSYIRQGTVLYPVDILHDVLQNYWGGSKGYIVIDVPIGTVETSASRESLAMTPEVEQIIDQVEVEVESALHDMIQARIDSNAETVADVFNLISEMKGIFSASQLDWQQYTLNGQPIRPMRGTIVDCVVYNCLRYDWKNRTTSNKFQRDVNFYYDKSYMNGYFRAGWQTGKRPKDMKLNKMPKKTLLQADLRHESSLYKDVWLVIDEGERVARSSLRLKEFCSANKVAVAIRPSQSDLKKLIRFFNIDDPKKVIKLSDVPDVAPPTTARSSGGATGPRPVVYRWAYDEMVPVEDEVWEERLQGDITDPENFTWLEIKGKSGPVLFDTVPVRESYFSSSYVVGSKGLQTSRSIIKKTLGVCHAARKVDPSLPEISRVFYLTANNAKKIGLKDDNRLDKLSFELAKEHGEAFLESLTIESLTHRFLPWNVYSSKECMEALGLDFKASQQSDSEIDEEIIMAVVGHDKVTERHKELQEELNETLSAYPFLKDGKLYSVDPKEIVVYIEAMNCYNERKALAGTSATNPEDDQN